MKIALVHDYIKEMGGAERVLRVLAEMYPEAPVYTAFRVRGSVADECFKDREIKESWLAPILKIGRLYSPLRFLTPLIWRTMDLSDYDLVITSSSWYITRGFKVGEKTKVICYCHTPPRHLYGYETSAGDWLKYWPVKLYATVVGHYLRKYDFKSAKEVDLWIANSENVRKRIAKFYREKAEVVYPPVDVKRFKQWSKKIKKKEYFLIVSRIVGAKGLVEAARAAKEVGFDLKIVGKKEGAEGMVKKIEKAGGKRVELMGRVDDKEIGRLFAEAKGFIALAKEEDFGITPVEAMAAGTAVIAFNGGGFRESVVDGKTGLLIEGTDTETLRKAMIRFNKIKWKKNLIQKQAEKFSREEFEKGIKKVISKARKK